MGTATENERIKLTATFYNNLSVGAAIVGLISPLLIFYQTADIIKVLAGHLPPGSEEKAFQTLIAIAVAAFICGMFRALADQTIRKLRD